MTSVFSTTSSLSAEFPSLHRYLAILLAWVSLSNSQKFQHLGFRLCDNDCLDLGLHYDAFAFCQYQGQTSMASAIIGPELPLERIIRAFS